MRPRIVPPACLALATAWSLVLTAACGQTGSPAPAGDPIEATTDAAAAAETAEADIAPEPEPEADRSPASAPALAVLDPLPFERLMTVLPAPAGWTRTQDRGHEVSEPVRQSVAEARYTRGETDVDLAIVDTGRSRVLLAPYEMFLSTGFEERASNGLTRAIRVNGSPGFERWDQSPHRGEVVVMVAQRYIVRVSSTTAPRLDVLTSLMDAVNLSRLESLR